MNLKERIVSIIKKRMRRESPKSLLQFLIQCDINPYRHYLSLPRDYELNRFKFKTKHIPRSKLLTEIVGSQMDFIRND